MKKHLVFCLFLLNILILVCTWSGVIHGQPHFYRCACISENGYRIGAENQSDEASGIANAGAKVFPNPTTGNLNVFLSSNNVTENSNEPMSLRVTDLLGRALHSSFIQYNTLLEIDLTGFPVGMYLLSIHKNNQLMYHQRISKVQ